MTKTAHPNRLERLTLQWARETLTQGRRLLEEATKGRASIRRLCMVEGELERITNTSLAALENDVTLKEQASRLLEQYRNLLRALERKIPATAISVLETADDQP